MLLPERKTLTETSRNLDQDDGPSRACPLPKNAGRTQLAAPPPPPAASAVIPPPPATRSPAVEVVAVPASPPHGNPETLEQPESVQLPYGDQPWIVDKANTRGILESFVDPENDFGIPAALQSLERVMGDRFCERCWSQCLDCLTAAPDESCVFTVSDVLETYGYPGGYGVIDHEHQPADARDDDEHPSLLDEFMNMPEEADE